MRLSRWSNLFAGLPAACFLLGAEIVAAQDISGMHAMPGRDAPAGVMGSMLHHKGEWMLGFRLMRMRMDGNRDGTKDLTEDEVFDAGYEMTPLNMNSTMAMVDAMYGISDGVTLMATLPFVWNSMDMRMLEGETFTMQARGLGDVRLSALIGLWRGERGTLHLHAGLQLPTGKVDATDDMPGCAGCKVDYPTQPGSGTWNLAPGLTWVSQRGPWSWGAQWIETLRLGENDEGYAFGNRHELSAWGVRHLHRTVSASLRLSAVAWGNVDGADSDFDPMMTPTQDSAAQGGRRIDLSLGLGVQPASGALSAHRFALEVGLPLWQDLDGPQLSTKWEASISWQLWF